MLSSAEIELFICVRYPKAAKNDANKKKTFIPLTDFIFLKKEKILYLVRG